MSKARDIADLNFDNPDIDGGTIDGATINATGLTVDTDTLYVDSTNNRVGIGTDQPIGKLEINGGGVPSQGTLIVRQSGNTEDDGIALTSVNSTSHRIWKSANGTFNIGPSNDTDAFSQDLSGNLSIGGNIRMPWSSSKYLIGPVPRSSNVFLTSFDSLEINGADAVLGGQAMAGGSVIIRGGDGVANPGTNSYAGSVTIAGGQKIGGGTSGTGSVKIQTSGVDRLTVSGGGIATFTGNSGTSEGNLRSTSSSGHSYIGVNRDTEGQGEVGYSWNTGNATKWWNYLSANSDEMRWYSDGANRLTLTQSGHLTASGGMTSSGALHQTGETQSAISATYLGTQKLGGNATLYTYDHYDVSWNTSTETKNIFEVSHNSAGWSDKYIMIEVFHTMYNGGGYARYYLNHQYGSNTLAQIEKNGNNSNVTAQMTGLATVSGTVKKSTFQLVMGYYQEAYVRVTSTMSASTSITAANQLRFL